MRFETEDINFQLAEQFIHQTAKNIFLTGKAGTGKTTFLRLLKENCTKKMAVVSPTGVAAVTAGGVTIHSLFQLPLGAFVPDANFQVFNHSGFINAESLFRNLRMTRAKRELLSELELLVVDEASMLRADVLDMVDLILRHVRQKHQPFGGVQLLLIGDLFQLPPVIKQTEWQVLKLYYKSPFFFDATSMRNDPPLYMELKKIYRQKDAAFIQLLNNVRHSAVTDTDLAVLNKCYQPGFKPPKDHHYITLTSHNYKADTINQTQLNALLSNAFHYVGTVEGNFNENALPAERQLVLKVGAQVMMLRNDRGNDPRYYNGKIGIITELTPDKIMLRFPAEEEELEVKKEEWKNIRYKYDPVKDKIEEEELGSYAQYPLRLAWAITIHKSQGLTFEKAIIDAGASFAAGQVYVALSRLTSINKLVLYSKIGKASIKTNEKVLIFSQSAMLEDQLQVMLKQESANYIRHSLFGCFDWNGLFKNVSDVCEKIRKINGLIKPAAVKWARKLSESVKKQQNMGRVFSNELKNSLDQGIESSSTELRERIEAAEKHFGRELDNCIKSIEAFSIEIGLNQREKKLDQSLTELYEAYTNKRAELKAASKLMRRVNENSTVKEI